MFPFSPGFYSPGFSSLMGFLLSWFLFFSGFSDLTVDLLSWLSTLLVYLSSVLYSPGFSLFCIFYSPGFYFFLFFFSSGFFSLLNYPSLWFLASSVVFKSFSPTNFVSPMHSCSFCQSVPFLDSNSLLISELGIWRGSFYCSSENRAH